MKRELKFRAYDPYLKKMICDEFFIIGETPVDDISSLERLLSLEIMQFTGLLDKNGKEIYEGDLIGGTKTLQGQLLCWPVVWYYDGWKIGGKGKPHSVGQYFWKQHEVISNIYENADLLAINLKDDEG